ncbi:unnamed protein product, partial [Heterosigma akashiwo]
ALHSPSSKFSTAAACLRNMCWLEKVISVAWFLASLTLPGLARRQYHSEDRSFDSQGSGGRGLGPSLLSGLTPNCLFIPKGWPLKLSLESSSDSLVGILSLAFF